MPKIHYHHTYPNCKILRFDTIITSDLYFKSTLSYTTLPKASQKSRNATWFQYSQPKQNIVREKSPQYAKALFLAI